jgi:hypothetical protein
MALNFDALKQLTPHPGLNLGPDVNIGDLSGWVRTFALARGVHAVVIPGRNSRWVDSISCA